MWPSGLFLPLGVYTPASSFCALKGSLALCAVSAILMNAHYIRVSEWSMHAHLSVTMGNRHTYNE